MAALSTLVLVATVAIASCTPVEPFTCGGHDDACDRGGRGGRCEPTGYCTFEDPGCASGRRYDDSAGGDLSGACLVSGCPGGICRCTAQVSAGAYHTCAISEAGLLSCWGRNDSGQVGWDGGDAFVPQVVDDTRTASVVSGGTRHTCAVFDRRAYCWGDGGSGRLGDGSSTHQDLPVQVLLDGDVDEVAAGGTHSCARVGGALYCFGTGSSGQIGDGSETAQEIPVPVDTAGPVSQIALGATHTCALREDGEVVCWGLNNQGQTGIAESESEVPVPTAVAGLHGVLAICAGESHTCALTPEREVSCWGANLRGQLGTEEPSGQPPTRVPGATSVVAITCGGQHTCARREDDVLCWGDQTTGQLGDPSVTFLSRNPVRVRDLGTTLAVSAGGGHTCAVTDAGALHCWGSGADGRLGLGTAESAQSIDADHPVAVPCGAAE